MALANAGVSFARLSWAINTLLRLLVLAVEVPGTKMIHLLPRTAAHSTGDAGLFLCSSVRLGAIKSLLGLA